MSQKNKVSQAGVLTTNGLMALASQVVDFGASVIGKDTATDRTKSLKFTNPFKDFKFKQIDIKKFSKILRYKYIIAAVVLALLFFAFIIVKLSKLNPSSIVSSSQTNFTPQAQATLNRKFEIPIRSADGAEIGTKLGITLTTAEKSTKILIQGKPATARDTKTFLIMNLEINNATNNQLTVRPVDFIRLVDSEGRSYAPDVHNNEVITEPVSIKKTRVGFVVDANQKNFKFNVGELKGTKETVEVNL